jgi:hypothetical protein
VTAPASPTPTRVTRTLGILRSGRWLIAQSFVLVPAAAVGVSLLSGPEYRSVTTIEFTGANTGSRAGDVDQARSAFARDRSLAARALDVTGSGRLGPAELQNATELLGGSRPGTLDVAVNDASRARAQALSGELARQLARDQLVWVVAGPARASKVTPRPLNDGMLALAAAIPIGVALAAGLDAVRRRRLRDT